jgi:hypothetical protein
MNPTLAERSRQQQRLALAHGRSARHPVDPELPIALTVYLQAEQPPAPAAAKAEIRQPPESIEPEATQLPGAAGQPAAELLLWLGLLLLDGALALLDLIGQQGWNRRHRARQKATAATNVSPLTLETMLQNRTARFC